MSDIQATPMLTVKEALQYVWCPRFAWFMLAQNIPQYAEKRYKVRKGQEVHRRRDQENRAYLRRSIGAAEKARNVYLASPRLRLRGIVDELLRLKDGTLAPLDYKYSAGPEEGGVFEMHRMQVWMYALLAREVYGQPVTRGYVAYARAGNRLEEVAVTDDCEQEVGVLVDNVFAIIHTGRFPKRTFFEERCGDCCYKNICA